MSVDHIENPTHADLLRVLGYDLREPTSIYSSWAAARDNARRAREVIPLDLWESINTTWQQLPRAPFGVAGAHTFLNWARERSALFAGIARGIMVRDDGWQFMSMGRSLGAGRHDLADGGLGLADRRQHPSGRRCSAGCGGHDAFLRTYRGVHTDREAAQFLILDARFPRSIMHGLVAASDSLRKITQQQHAGRAAVRVRCPGSGPTAGPVGVRGGIDDLLTTWTPR